MTSPEQPTPEPSAALTPPPRWPPTAVGVATPPPPPPPRRRTPRATGWRATLARALAALRALVG